MILIYTHKITPRVRYIFRQIFTRILLIPVDFTSKVEEFVAYNGSKISYTKVPLGNEFFIESNELLFQQGINNIEIEIQKWGDLPCFFPLGKKSTIPFDIFSASFYLISRYEEYLPHIKDKHERFKATESLAYQHYFLEKPLVDIWAYKLLFILKERFTCYTFKQRSYKYISTIDIDQAFTFKHKSFFRTLGASLKSLSKLNLFTFANRLFTFLGFKKDPFNTFDELLRLKKQYGIKTIFFFLVGNYSEYDKNISVAKNKFRLLIKDMVDYAEVGLHPSYYTKDDLKRLKKEKERLESVTNTPAKRSRQHYLRFSLPQTYQYLIDLEIEEDYSMGYASHTGFRASTCTPFYFYDLEFEIQTPLKIFPFAVMDTTLNDYLKLTPKQSLGKIRDLKEEVKKVNGVFITLFHNDSLSNYERWRGWEKVYGSMLKIAVK